MPQPDCRPLADSSCKSKDLEEEFLVYDPDGDQVHVLNEVAREIFLLCDGTRRPAEIAAAMVERYEVKQEQALVDVNKTIDRLIEMGLLRT